MSPLEPTVAAALGIADLSYTDQVAYLSEKGDVIFVTAMDRFEPLLSVPEQEQLATFLAQEPEPEEVLNFLVQQHDTFLPILESVAKEINEA